MPNCGIHVVLLDELVAGLSRIEGREEIEADRERDQREDKGRRARSRAPRSAAATNSAPSSGVKISAVSQSAAHQRHHQVNVVGDDRRPRPADRRRRNAERCRSRCAARPRRRSRRRDPAPLTMPSIRHVVDAAVEHVCRDTQNSGRAKISVVEFVDVVLVAAARCRARSRLRAISPAVPGAEIEACRRARFR